jgi:hypothetical protein
MAERVPAVCARPCTARRRVLRTGVGHAWRGATALLAFTGFTGLAGLSAPAAAAGALCPARASRPKPPADAVDVRRFGVRGDGQQDDTVALQRALDSLSNGQWLVFPPGRYRHHARLVLQRPGVTLFGYGATLHATNPDDQALLIQASGVRVMGFTLTAVTDERRHAPWQSRLAIWRHGQGLPPVHDIELRDNRILESGPPGSPLANSSSSAAIFVHNVHGFVVLGNEVRRSLSDGIHITGGARQGQVIGNTIRESGDDMIAVVSYLGHLAVGEDRPEAIARELPQRRLHGLVQDVLIADNDVAGQYWGRGISVVGGEQVSIVNNRIDATTHGAGVYIAREQGWGTFGVRNVRVAGNHITRVQTTSAAYSVLSLPDRIKRTGHGAVELVAHQFDDEAKWPELRQALTVQGVTVQDNTIEDSATAGIRLGYGWNQSFVQTLRNMARRPFAGAPVRDVVLLNNRMQGVARGIEWLNALDAEGLLRASGNTLDGRPLLAPQSAPLLSQVHPPALAPQRNAQSVSAALATPATGSGLPCPREVR